MATYRRETPIHVPADELYAWHARPGAFSRLTPPWQSVTVQRMDGIEDGDRAVFRLEGPGPLGVQWIAEHTDHRLGRGFTDWQVRGPFERWRHEHQMLPSGPEASVLRDHITYRLPLAPVSHWIGGGLAQAQLDRMFAYRHRVTRADAERHRASGLSPLTVAVTGASGLVGRALVAFLKTGGHRVVRLVRSPDPSALRPRDAADRAVYWSPERQELDARELDGVDAVVHLAGEGVASGRWTPEKKRRIWESRTLGTHLIASAIASMSRPPRVLLSASASGYYGDTGDAAVTEAQSSGTGFLAAVCRNWEAATGPAEAAGIRTAHLRIGVVLTPAGGFLKTVLPPFRVGLGGTPGSGRGFVPWIVLDDVLYAILHLLADDHASGPVNLSAPEPARLKDVTAAIGQALKRPVLLKAPQAVVEALGGEVGRELVSKSTRMIPARLLESGFAFAYPTLPGALGHVLGTATTVSPPLQSPLS